MKTITVECAYCHKSIDKLKKEYNRRIRSGKNTFYCNLSCATYGKPALVNNFGKYIDKIRGLKRQNDEYSSFRYYIIKANSRQRIDHYGESDLDVQYLKELWEQQKGICPYTGYTMELPVNTQDHHIKGCPKRASLDRIDSEKGYIKGNVEFVCLSVNYAKNGFTRQQMMDFFKR